MIVIADYEVPAGQPLWMDVCTGDAAESRDFYSGLFGWEYESYPDPCGRQYSVALADGVPVAGVRERPADPALAGALTGWTLYLASPDVVDTAADVRRLGGRVLEGPSAIPWFGRRLLGADPTGATIAFWQPGTQWQCRLFEPGSLWWAELSTTDAAAADAFYDGLFGYQHKAFGDSGYLVWMLHGTPYLGRKPAIVGRPPRWMLYFVVPAGSTVEGVADRATRLGGTVPVQPFDHSHGRATVLADRSGAQFTVLEVRRPA